MRRPASPPPDAEDVRLLIGEGRSYRETGDILGCAASTVARVVRLARVPRTPPVGPIALDISGIFDATVHRRIESAIYLGRWRDHEAPGLQWRTLLCRVRGGEMWVCASRVVRRSTLDCVTRG